jgi:hypothetical protein
MSQARAKAVAATIRGFHDWIQAPPRRIRGATEAAAPHPRGETDVVHHDQDLAVAARSGESEALDVRSSQPRYSGSAKSLAASSTSHSKKRMSGFDVSTAYERLRRPRPCVAHYDKPAGLAVCPEKYKTRASGVRKLPVMDMDTQLTRAASGAHTAIGRPNCSIALTTHLVVAPAEKALAFYRDLLEARVLDVTTFPGSSAVAHAELHFGMGKLTLGDP